MKKPSNLSFQPFEKALKSLKNALQSPPKNDLERDGVIQRFEYSFELAWKSVRGLLLALGRAEVSSSPRPLLKDAAEENLITDIELWDSFLEARNQTTHTYNELTANEVYDIVKKFPKAADDLLKKIKKLSNEAK